MSSKYSCEVLYEDLDFKITYEKTPHDMGSRCYISYIKDKYFYLVRDETIYQAYLRTYTLHVGELTDELRFKIKNLSLGETS